MTRFMKDGLIHGNTKNCSTNLEQIYQCQTKNCQTDISKTDLSKTKTYWTDPSKIKNYQSN